MIFQGSLQEIISLNWHTTNPCEDFFIFVFAVSDWLEFEFIVYFIVVLI